MATDDSIRSKAWTSEEEEILRLRYVEEGPTALAAILGRSIPSVRSHALGMGLRVNKTYPTGKRCSKCGKVKPLTEFGSTLLRSKGRGLRPTRKPTRRPFSRCKACELQRKYAWQKQNPAKMSGQYRRQHLNRWGLTPERYAEILRGQGNGCGICGRKGNGGEKGKKPRSFAVDHHHETGAIRGLLCTRCNNLIGAAREDASILRNAIAYLERHKQE